MFVPDVYDAYSSALERAQATAEKAISLDNQDPKLWVNLGAIYVEKGMHAQELSVLNRRKEYAAAGI